MRQLKDKRSQISLYFIFIIILSIVLVSYTLIKYNLDYSFNYHNDALKTCLQQGIEQLENNLHKYGNINETLIFVNLTYKDYIFKEIKRTLYNISKACGKTNDVNVLINLNESIFNYQIRIKNNNFYFIERTNLLKLMNTAVFIYKNLKDGIPLSLLKDNNIDEFFEDHFNYYVVHLKDLTLHEEFNFKLRKK